MKLSSIIVLAAFLLSGCAQMFTASTKASYTSPDGRILTYESNKDFQGIDVYFKDGDKEVKIRVDKSGTPEAVTAAALEAQIKMIDLLGSQLKAGKMP